MKSISGKSKLNDNGRIVIPAGIRKEMFLNPGDTVIMTLQDGVLKIESQQARVRQVQRSLNSLIPAGRQLSSELIEYRRDEAHNEVEEWLG
ncbi:MAG TPA: AbrB/MazE/SpoVT family DNA-binding domain-containing protein [Terracidiphilus sp.]|nr:AbrB/MazE/SpoVT family DNA-binding domain-containing protein [Terracidiphilus sp.]